jgi:aerobic-type carbon monoxide dehydrogenase small subunit (CoxS/CutS family)
MTQGTWWRISVHVNGAPVDAVVPADRRLATFLRDDLGLTGTKLGCEVGVCGVCTVLVDQCPTSSCLTLAIQVDGADIRTVEGLEDTPEGRRLQQEFIEQGGFQCGYCTSGQLMTATAVAKGRSLDEAEPHEVVEQLHGNLCRCTGYYGIVRAIEASS